MPLQTIYYGIYPDLLIQVPNTTLFTTQFPIQISRLFKAISINCRFPRPDY